MSVKRVPGYGARNSYTPSWTSTGTAPSIGNGSLTGQWAILGPGLMWVQIVMTYGSTSTAGTGNYRWSMPPGYTFTGLEPGGGAQFRDSSTSGQRAVGHTNMENSLLSVKSGDVSANVSDWGASVPVAPGSGDSWNLNAILRFT